MGTSYNPKIVTDGLVLNLDPANVKSYPANQDPFVNNVSLMLDGESLVDQSANARTFTASVGASVSTANKKFGSSSIYCTGSSSYIYNSSFNSSFSGDFTIEFWAYYNSFGASNTLIAVGNESSGRHVTFINSGGKVAVDLYFVGVVGTFNTTISTGTWNHYVLTRSGTTVKLFVNGTLDSTTVSVSGTFGNGNGVYIGAVSTAAAASNAYFDDIRITSGISRYAASFTPPVAPLSLPGRLTDLTKNKLNTTLISGPTYSGGSLVFDGSTQYINVGSNSNLILGTNNFALELWFKPIARLQSYPFLLHNQVGGGGFTTNCWQINDRHANNPTLVTFWNYNYNAGSSAMLASTSIANGNWYHLVITRIGNLFSMYLNSTLQSSVTSSISMDNGVAKNYGFNTTGGGGFNGNASSIKIYNNKGLTAAEVFQNYNATKGRFIL